MDFNLGRHQDPSTLTQMIGDISHGFQDPAPEGFTFGFIVMLSSIAVVASAVLLRKHNLPKIAI